jgi:hypothetical protein
MLDRRFKGSLFIGLGLSLLSISLVLSLMGCSSPSLVSIKVTPTAEYFGGPGGHAQFTAIGTFNSGNHPPTTQDITSQVTWKSNAPQVATVSTSGLVTSGAAVGTTNITASMNGFTGLIIANATAQVCSANQTPTNTGCSGSSGN